MKAIERKLDEYQDFDANDLYFMLILASASVDMSGTVPVYNVYTVYYYVSSICTVGCVILSENPNFNFGI